ncbi:helix-turn-helix domain-containing protein [Embleya sp. NPDC005575]|uniref:MarR family transcriptional regulator n=1 Tax=Embleya sp. NPDC005575 TaxID=3156892 RepID=UPI0033BE75C6
MTTPMTPVELFLLGRTLMKIGEDALPAPRVPADGTDRHPGSVRSALIALSDIVAHPDSAVGEIARRTGLPQSQVSTAVARLKETGSIETTQDPTDRRRLLVRPAATPSPRVAEARAAGIEDALARAMATTDEQAVAEVAEALALLARHLPPVALARLRS